MTLLYPDYRISTPVCCSQRNLNSWLRAIGAIWLRTTAPTLVIPILALAMSTCPMCSAQLKQVFESEIAWDHWIGPQFLAIWHCCLLKIAAKFEVSSKFQRGGFFGQFQPGLVMANHFGRHIAAHYMRELLAWPH